MELDLAMALPEEVCWNKSNSPEQYDTIVPKIHKVHTPDPDHMSVDLLKGTAPRHCIAPECYGYYGTDDTITKCMTGKIPEELPLPTIGTMDAGTSV